MRGVKGPLPGFITRKPRGLLVRNGPPSLTGGRAIRLVIPGRQAAAYRRADVAVFRVFSSTAEKGALDQSRPCRILQRVRGPASPPFSAPGRGSTN
jgi:hypothetical protein